MGSFLAILFVSLAGLALTYGEQQPVAHDRLVRRCENETHPWFPGNSTDPQPPWATGWLSPARSQPTEAPTLSFPNCGSVSCPSETEPTANTGNTSSSAFAFSPEQTSLDSGPTWSNETATSDTGQGSSPPTSSPPFDSKTSVDSNTTPSLAALTASNTTIASGGNTGSVESNTSKSNATTQTTSALNTPPLANTTPTPSVPIWSIPVTNLTYNGTGPPWGTGGPLWTNTSFSVLGYTSPSETRSPPEFQNSVITWTVVYTPAPITPSPLTPPPENITLITTVPESRTSLDGSNYGTASLNGTGTTTSSSLSSESESSITTNVVASNTTDVVLPSHSSASFTGWSNSSLISAVSGSLTTGGSTSQPTDNITLDSFTTLTPSPTGDSNVTNSSTESTSPPSTNATASTSGTASDNSTSTYTSNTTVTSAASGNTDGIPTSIPTSLFWPNTTHPTPCSLPSDIWRDWNWTALTGSPFSFPGGNPSVTAFASPSSSDGFNGTYSETPSNTATPSSGTWFGMTTFSNGSVATTFSTQFGAAPAASDEGRGDPDRGRNGASVSTSAPEMRHHVVIPPRRQVGWAYAA